MISIKNVSFAYKDQLILNKVSLNIPNNSLIAVTGSNGAGKSTLLKLIAGLIQPSQGLITTSCKVAYLPQRSEIDHNFPLSVKNVVAMGLWPSTKFSYFSQTIKDKIDDLLSQIGIQNLKNYPLSVLSGGQLQRVLFARIMALNANLLLLDEPFNAIDQATCHDLLQIILKWHKNKKSIIVVLHDTHLVKKFFPQTIIVQDQDIKM